VRCASCGTENETGTRFCDACGAALVAGCPSCGRFEAPHDGQPATSAAPHASQNLVPVSFSVPQLAQRTRGIPPAFPRVRA